jgi:hypothetical protein
MITYHEGPKRRHGPINAFKWHTDTMGNYSDNCINGNSIIHVMQDSISKLAFV